MKSEIRTSSSVGIRNNSITKLRRCRTDEGRTQGKYFPNVKVSSLEPDARTQRKPSKASGLLDDSLSDWLTEDRKKSICAIAEANCMLYISYPSIPKDDDPFSVAIGTTSASWWLLHENDKIVGVTALHSIDLPCPLEDIRLFLSKDERNIDKFSLFEDSAGVGKYDAFFEIKPRLDLYEKRNEWLKTVNLTDAEARLLFLDPEFLLQPHPALDILFTSVPEQLSKVKPLTISKNPQPGSTFGHIGFNFANEAIDKGLYDATFPHNVSPPETHDLLFGGRSISLGQVCAAGSIVTFVSSNSEGSSGGCMVNDSMEVFAIATLSFYDDPFGDSPRSNLFDIEVKEGSKKAINSKNRNLGLSFSHPGVVYLLNLIYKLHNWVLIIIIKLEEDNKILALTK